MSLNNIITFLLVLIPVIPALEIIKARKVDWYNLASIVLSGILIWLLIVSNGQTEAREKESSKNDSLKSLQIERLTNKSDFLISKNYSDSIERRKFEKILLDRFNILWNATTNQPEKLTTSISAKLYLLDQKVNGKQVTLTFGNPDNAPTFDVSVNIKMTNPVDTAFIYNTGSTFKSVRDFYSSLSPEKQLINFRATKVEAGIRIMVTIIKKSATGSNFSIEGVGKLF